MATHVVRPEAERAVRRPDGGVSGGVGGGVAGGVNGFATTEPVLSVHVGRGWLVGPLVAGLALAAVSAVLQLAKGRGWQPGSLQLDQALNADEDLSVLNWMTSSTFLLAAVAALVLAGAGCGAHRLTGRWSWLGAAAVLSVASLDEVVGLHGPVQDRAEQLVVARGPAAALLVCAAVAAAVGAARFVLRQEPAVRARLLACVVLLAAAAVGIDAVGPDLTDDPRARLEPLYVAKATTEEVLELCAALLAVDACLLAAGAPRRRPRRALRG